jgi:hypothetical protein
MESMEMGIHRVIGCKIGSALKLNISYTLYLDAEHSGTGIVQRKRIEWIGQAIAYLHTHWLHINLLVVGLYRMDKIGVDITNLRIRRKISSGTIFVYPDS